MDNFFYHTPTKIYFGKGEENNVGKYVKEYHPHKVMIIYGLCSVKKSGLLDKVTAALDEEGISYLLEGGVIPNPELPKVYELIDKAKKEGVDFVLAVGGGSVIDTAKDVANGVANPDDDVWDYHLKLKKPSNSLKKAAILTISAAGSEMSDSSVISNPATKVKCGYNNDFNRLDFAILNPELTYSVSKYQTACGIVDIGMHTIERYFTPGNETELTDSIAEAIIKNTFIFGKIAYENPNDYNARAELMWASSLSHNNLTNCGKPFLLTVHQLEHELSAMYPTIAHGAGLAALWCSWARFVYQDAVTKFMNYFSKVWDIDFNSTSVKEGIIQGINLQENYYKEIGMPIGLKELGVKETDLEELALRCSKNKTRIIPGYKKLGYDEILAIYKLAFDND